MDNIDKKNKTNYELASKMIRAKALISSWFKMKYRENANNIVYNKFCFDIESKFKEIDNTRSDTFWNKIIETQKNAMLQFAQNFKQLSNEKTNKIEEMEENENVKENDRTKNKNIMTYFKSLKHNKNNHDSEFHYTDEIKAIQQELNVGNEKTIEDLRRELKTINQNYINAKENLKQWEQLPKNDKIKNIVDYSLSHNGQLMPEFLDKEENIEISCDEYISKSILKNITNSWVKLHKEGSISKEDNFFNVQNFIPNEERITIIQQ